MPISILREQAALLGAKTKNMVKATVEHGRLADDLDLRFNLVVPALDHYRYQLFHVTQSARGYPLTVYEDRTVVTINDEATFVDWLARKLSSEDTRQLVNNLLGLVNA